MLFLDKPIWDLRQQLPCTYPILALIPPFKVFEMER